MTMKLRLGHELQANGKKSCTLEADFVSQSVPRIRDKAPLEPRKPQLYPGQLGIV